MTSSAVWLGSWSRGVAAPDDVLEALTVSAPDAPAVVAVRGAPPAPLPDLLREIRQSAPTMTWLLLPRPGRTLGWPPDALGVPTPAVLLTGGQTGSGLLRHDQSGWRWDITEAVPAAPLEAEMLTPRSGARALAAAVNGAADRLERLALDRPTAGSPARTWERAVRRLPPGIDPQVEALLARLGDLRDVLDLALAEEGAAVTAGEALARSGELRTVIGQLDDVVTGVVGGLNLPATGMPGPDPRSPRIAERPA
jgi:hypothetical protein